eukprot:CAMPEP_0194321604 /NCGR_PEP_ID=MMETSP0171-20130528/17813_1 /TAXON_ID=218684 /ORGANISM="Corethron pennatum, Strain L29A3" /LENGTH=189 /DNA_ID=CAMNT_0039079571 /DNA_START=56 /DNA_END=624 /DNA_ORIENTATION=+
MTTAKRATIETIPTDVLEEILSMLSPSYRFLAPVCRIFHSAHEKKYPGKTETLKFEMASIVQLQIYMMERNDDNDKAIVDIRRDNCFVNFDARAAASYVAAGAGQQEMVEWTGIMDWRTCAGAAKGGRRETLEWMMAKGCRWDQKTCMYAAMGGQLEIIKLLKEERVPVGLAGVRQGGQGRAPGGSEVA